MGKGHHHHGGYPPFSWSWGPGWGQWWDQPRSEIILVGDDNKDRDKILAYIASLPEKERGKAFEKFFGTKASGLGLDSSFLGAFKDPKFLALAGFLAFGYWFMFRSGANSRKNPARRRRRR